MIGLEESPCRAVIELLDWEAPDQYETPPKNSDVGAMHLALHVEHFVTTIDTMANRNDVTVLDGPQTNGARPTTGLTYVYFQVDWGVYLELLEQLDRMPYADDTTERLYGLAPS